MAGILIITFVRSTVSQRCLRLGEGAGGVAREAGLDLDRHLAVLAVRAVVHRAEHVARHPRRRPVMIEKTASLTDAPAFAEFGHLRVVGRALGRARSRRSSGSW